MRGLCTNEAPEFRSLENQIRFRDDLEKNPDAIEGTELSPTAVVVRVLTAAVSVDDIHGAEGTYVGRFRSSPPKRNKSEVVSPEKPYIPGFECCGIVVRAGEKAIQDFPVGTYVMGFQDSIKNHFYGTWGEYFTFDPTKSSLVPCVMLKKPSHLTHEQAAAALVPGQVACCTLSKYVYDAMSHSGGLLRSTMVIVGATGAVGNLVVKAARHEWPQATIVAVCSGKNSQFAMELGASDVLAYDQVPEWGAHELVKGKTDVVLDLIGGSETLKQGRLALRQGGVFSSTVGPRQFIGDTGTIPILPFLLQITAMLGRVAFNPLRRSYKYYVRDMSYHQNMALYTRLLEDERVLIPHVDRVVNTDDEAKVREAISDVRHHKCKGRVVFRITSDN